MRLYTIWVAGDDVDKAYAVDAWDETIIHENPDGWDEALGKHEDAKVLILEFPDQAVLDLWAPHVQEATVVAPHTPDEA